MPDQYMAQIRVGLGQPGPSTSTAAKRPFQDLDAGGEETKIRPQVALPQVVPTRTSVRAVKDPPQRTLVALAVAIP
jgi:hypothetical protein